ncbi:dTDP-4-dehydrorhamnose reductase [Spirulina major CS-329]|uniref:dTDP-4-dehydrorhamnose reductase n=1 Tax=Spirulina TaxID=1154 RepID=UPI00232F7DB4|nr:MULTISPECIES: dTDP-4-dehydrorhamnose reductase [Spirulina]MDB9493948.1 dTDP-4-dehydrorhamnose reductase [Spirulina subsalsa CS-330]MDB9503707.1 dTDP-4-dehydrorhamnose reductase [Spirulina major CS-329]
MNQTYISVLLVGAGGQLGQALIATAPPQVQIKAFNRQQLDISDRAAVIDLITETKPTWVINAAAYTAVDQAEKEPTLAFTINGDGPGYLAQAVETIGGRLLHISTDFVFDGKASRPYQPDDRPNPLSVYGESKLAGEQQILRILGEKSLIIRTAWLYSVINHNFVSTMLRLMQTRDEVRVVADQVGTPTAATTLAQVLWQSIAQDIQGIYHVTDAGVASWYDFAVAIQHHSYQLHLLDRVVPVQPISTLEFPTLAKRPSYSVLDKSRTWQQLAITPHHWQAVLYKTLQTLSPMN